MLGWHICVYRQGGRSTGSSYRRTRARVSRCGRRGLAGSIGSKRPCGPTDILSAETVTRIDTPHKRTICYRPSSPDHPMRTRLGTMILVMFSDQSGLVGP
jgi:hypothetical protein